MPTSITRAELHGLRAAGAQLVEVLPRAEYLEEHLPGALSLPLRELTAETAGALDRGRPVWSTAGTRSET
jgi:rhodanese-related sulfurtransferase